MELTCPGPGLCAQPEGEAPAGCFTLPAPLHRSRSALLAIEPQPHALPARRADPLVSVGEAGPRRRFAEFFQRGPTGLLSLEGRAAAASEFLAGAPQGVIASSVAGTVADAHADADAPAAGAPAEVLTAQDEASRAEMQAASAMRIAREAGAAAEKAEEAADHAEEAEMLILCLNAVAGLTMLGVACMARRTYLRWMAHQKRCAECYRAALEASAADHCGQGRWGPDDDDRALGRRGSAGSPSSTGAEASAHSDGDARAQL